MNCLTTERSSRSTAPGQNESGRRVAAGSAKENTNSEGREVKEPAEEESFTKLTTAGWLDTPTKSSYLERWKLPTTFQYPDAVESKFLTAFNNNRVARSEERVAETACISKTECGQDPPEWVSQFRERGIVEKTLAVFLENWTNPEEMLDALVSKGVASLDIPIVQKPILKAALLDWADPHSSCESSKAIVPYTSVISPAERLDDSPTIFKEIRWSIELREFTPEKEGFNEWLNETVDKLLCLDPKKETWLSRISGLLSGRFRATAVKLTGLPGISADEFVRRLRNAFVTQRDRISALKSLCSLKFRPHYDYMKHYHGVERLAKIWNPEATDQEVIVECIRTMPEWMRSPLLCDYDFQNLDVFLTAFREKAISWAEGDKRSTERASRASQWKGHWTVIDYAQTGGH